MLDRYSTHALTPLARRVDCVVWSYGPNVEDAIPEGMWERLQAAGMNLYGASAFKGASLPDACWVPIARHIANHQSWLRRSEYTKLEVCIA